MFNQVFDLALSNKPMDEDKFIEASLIDENDLELLRSTTRELKLGVIYMKIGLNFTNINTNSTREYDSINHNRYDLSYKIAI